MTFVPILKLKIEGLMRSYENLTRRGKIRRMRQVALKALEQYDLQVKRVRFLALETNTMFQVRTESNERFVLRIYSDEETTLRENKAEIFWLNALIRDTDIRVTEPVPRKDGEVITIVWVAGVPGERRCVLFKWVPGRPLEAQLSPENYFKLGQVMAQLHDHAEALRPLPPEICPKKWDKVFYYPDEPVIYNSPEYTHLFTPARIELLEEVIERADEVLKRLFGNRPDQILIHGDLHFWNVHTHRGDLYVIDFEDINLGYPVQDIAVTLYYGRQRDGFQQWKRSFESGYRNIRNWPQESEKTLETLMAARTVMFINYVARINPSPEGYIADRFEDLHLFLERYE